MKMVKARERKGDPERMLILGCIVSKEMLREVEPHYETRLMSSPHGGMIVEWCFDYFKKYGKAPEEHIEDIFLIKKRKGLLPEKSETLIGQLLASLLEQRNQSKKFNVEYATDMAINHLDHRKLEILTDDMRAHLSVGETSEAKALLSTYRPVEKQAAGVNPFTDVDTIFNAFTENEEPLFTFPLGLGQFFKGQLLRDGLVGLMGPEKRGKTWWLCEFTKQALLCRCNVAFFEAGDMSLRQIVRRMLTQISNTPITPGTKDYHCPMLDCVLNQKNECSHKHRKSTIGLGIADDEDTSDWGPEEYLKAAPRRYHPCSHCAKIHPEMYKGAVWWELKKPMAPLTWRKALTAGQKFSRRLVNRHFKLECYSNSTLSVRMIRQKLEQWATFEGWVPDVICIDYADILAPEDRRLEFRHQENEKWKALRALTQDFHCLGIVPTQANTASYEASLMRMKHFSEDKRKMAHVTSMVGLNQTESEKRKGLMRLNYIVLREDEFDVTRTVKVLQCLKEGRPHVASYI